MKLTRNNGRSRTRSRAGHTLIELIVSMGTASFILGGLSSCLYIASRSLDQGGTAQRAEADQILDEFVGDVEHALSFSERTANAVTFTVPDRDGNGLRETIRYAWSGTPGDPLTYEYNGSAGETIAADVYDFNLAAMTRFMAAEVIPPAEGGNKLLLVVGNSTSLTTEETAHQTLVESWGYTVEIIDDSDSQANFDAAVANNDVVLITNDITASNLGTKLVGATIGVVTSECNLSDEFGLASSISWESGTVVEINDDTHFITLPFSPGILSIFSSSESLAYVTGTLSPELGQLASSASGYGIVTLEAGAAMFGGGNTAGRRVQLPWGGNGFDPNNFTTDGQTLMRRAIEWAAGIGDGGDVTGAIAHWKLDETSGATASDFTGNGHNGSLNGSPTWTLGNIDGSLDFNGSSDYVSVTNDAALQLTNALSIAGWVKGNSWGSGSEVNVVIRKGEGNPNNYQLAIADGQVAFYLDDSDSNGIRGGTVLNTDEWYHVAATWDGSEVRIYLNGVLDGVPVSRTGTIGTDSRPVYLGGRAGADLFVGALDDVRIYGRALTPAEISTLAAAGGGGGCDVDPAGTYIEAENYSGTIAGVNAFFTVESSTAGFNGSGYLRNNKGDNFQPPRTEGRTYDLNFTETGTYKLWIRGYSFDGLTDTDFLGFDGIEFGQYTTNGIYNQWVWSDGVRTGGTNQFTVSTAGVHTITVWVRERDMLLDGIYITKGSETPSGGIPTGASILDPNSCGGGGAPTIVEVTVATGNDDAEEAASSGSVNLTSTDLELVSDGSTVQLVGMRFAGVSVPPGATISSAYIQFQVDETNSGATKVGIDIEASDNGATFTTSTNNISSRGVTGGPVPWVLPVWGTLDERAADQRTPDIAALVQAVVDRPGWSSGNAMVVIINGSGERTAESYNGSASGAAMLHIEY